MPAIYLHGEQCLNFSNRSISTEEIQQQLNTSDKIQTLAIPYSWTFKMGGEQHILERIKAVVEMTKDKNIIIILKVDQNLKYTVTPLKSLNETFEDEDKARIRFLIFNEKHDGSIYDMEGILNYEQIGNKDSAHSIGIFFGYFGGITLLGCLGFLLAPELLAALLPATASVSGVMFFLFAILAFLAGAYGRTGQFPQPMGPIINILLSSLVVIAFLWINVFVFLIIAAAVSVATAFMVAMVFVPLLQMLGAFMLILNNKDQNPSMSGSEILMCIISPIVCIVFAILALAMQPVLGLIAALSILLPVITMGVSILLVRRRHPLDSGDETNTLLANESSTTYKQPVACYLYYPQNDSNPINNDTENHTSTNNTQLTRK